MKKKTIIVALTLSLIAIFGLAQTNQVSDFQNGSIIGFNGEKTSGTIKVLFKQRGGIIFSNSSGSKKQLTPNEIKGFEVNNELYTNFSGDFYKVIVAGTKINLLQKETDNSGKIFYNGAQAISNTSTEGKIGDLYLQPIDMDAFWHVTDKNFTTIAESAFASCTLVLADVKAKRSTYDQLVAIVTKANVCK